MPPHLDRLAGFLAVTAALALAVGCGDDDDGGSEFGSGGSAGTGTGGSGNIGGLAGSGGTGGSSGSPDGGDAAAGSGGSGGDCTSYGQGDCAICLDQSCCAEAAACEKSSSCSGMVECARACPVPTDANSACVKDCASQHQLGGSEYNPLMLCMGNACGSVCPYP